MHGFINSPALAKLVALQMVDEDLHRGKRSRRTRTFRARLSARRTARSSAPAQAQRLSPTGKLVEDH